MGIPVPAAPEDNPFGFKKGDKVTVRFGNMDLTGVIKTPPPFIGTAVHEGVLDELETFTTKGVLHPLPETFTFEWGSDFPPPAITAKLWSDSKSDPLEDMTKVMEHFDKWPDPPPVPIAIYREDWEKARAARRGHGVTEDPDPFFPDGVAAWSGEYVQVPRELMAALLESLGGSFTLTVSDMRAAAMQNGPRTVVVDRWVDQSQGMMYRMRVEEPRP